MIYDSTQKTINAINFFYKRVGNDVEIYMLDRPLMVKIFNMRN